MKQENNFVDIIGFEGLYMINKNGAILSLPKNGTGLKCKILKQNVGKSGYWYVKLRKEGNTYHKNIHRLLAIQFIPNPYNKEQVNHIDGNKLNYSLDNLEWSTASENQQHAVDTGLRPNMSDEHKDIVRKNAKIAQEKTKVEILVYAKGKDTDFNLYESVSMAGRETGYNRGSINNTVKNGFVPSRKKFISIYKDDYLSLLRKAILGDAQALVELQDIEDYISTIRA